jgi:K+-sensing histidine kinase KdpD
MRKNHRTKSTKVRYATGLEPQSDVWTVVAEPRYDHMASVAREARTLLSALTANVDWVRSGLVDQVVAAGLLDGLADIETCCERINNLLEDALLGTRPDGFTVRRSMLSIGSVVSAAVKQVRRAAEAKKISIEVATKSDVAAMLDRALLTRAIGKLLERIVADAEMSTVLTVGYQLDNEQLALTFARADGLPAASPAGPGSVRPALPQGARGDLEFCHIVAESHGGALTVGAGLTLFRLVLPWVAPGSR